jgi:hypothetical protein
LALAARLGVLRRYGAKTQRSLEHFSIGHDLMPREMVPAYAILKKAAAGANRAGGRLDDERHRLIVQSCDEILAGADQNMFPLHVWMTGGGTQFNMNVKWGDLEPLFPVRGHAARQQNTVSPDLLKQGLLYPMQSNILKTEIQTAARVARLIFDSGLARVARPDPIVSFIREHVYEPTYATPAPQ